MVTGLVTVVGEGACVVVATFGKGGGVTIGLTGADFGSFFSVQEVASKRHNIPESTLRTIITFVLWVR